MRICCKIGCFEPVVAQVIRSYAVYDVCAKHQQQVEDELD